MRHEQGHLEPVKFSDLWKHYPDKPPYIDPKTGKPPSGFTNQCAIKVSVAIHGAGIEMKSFTAGVIGVNPKDFGRVEINGKNTATLAAQLAMWLKKQSFCGLPQQPENVTGEDWEKKIQGRTGIIFFGDYWRRDGESASSASGGHIDLWNKDALTSSFHTFLRFRIGVHRPWPRIYSDLRGAKTILFFEVK
jgi:hypothetical protein